MLMTQFMNYEPGDLLVTCFERGIVVLLSGRGDKSFSRKGREQATVTNVWVYASLQMATERGVYRIAGYDRLIPVIETISF
jgi:hypothetical protein